MAQKAGSFQLHESSGRECLVIVNDGDYFARHKSALVEPLCDSMRVTVASGGDARAISSKFNVAPVQVARTLLSLRSDLRLLHSLSRSYRRLRPELVISFTMKPSIYALFLALLPFSGLPADCRHVAELPGLGALFEARGLRGALARFFASWVLRRASSRLQLSFVFENNVDRRLFERKGFAKPGKTFVIPGTGLDLSLYDLPNMRDRDCVAILWAGRLVSGKGLDLFCGAARLLVKQGHKNLRFLVAGAPDEASADAIDPETLANTLSEPAVTYLGNVTDMPGLLSRVDILCHPSRYKEGLPRVLLEAAASGVAIAASSNAGTRAIVKDGVTGVIVDPLSAETLAEALASLAADPEKRKALAGNALKRLRDGGYDIKHVKRSFMRAAGISI